MRKISFHIPFWILILLVLAAGVTATLFVNRSVLAWEEKIIQADFNDIAGDRLAILQNSIDTNLTALWALQSFFSATPEVSRGQFEAFTRQLLRLHPDVSSYHWIPRVTDEKRASFEKKAKQELGNSFQIREMNPAGELSAARKTAEYFPSLFVEPFKRNYEIAGFNQFSVAERRRVMTKAAGAKTMIATRVHPLWRFRPEEKSAFFFVFLPVYENNQPSETLENRKTHLKGYVAAGFHVEQLIQAAFTTTNMSELSLEFYAETVDLKNASIHHFQMYLSPGSEAPARKEFSYREMVAIADQRWLVIAKSTEFFRNGAEGVGTNGLLMAGFLLTGLLCAGLILWHQQKRQDYFLRMSFRDELTDLYNRRGFLALANAHLKLMKRKKMESLILFADLDGLKEINDTYGHEEGDRALVAAAQILRGTFRDSDLVARTGGDEFAIFALDIGVHNEATVRRHLNENIERYNRLNPHPYKVLLSVGSIAVTPGPQMTLEKILAEADKAMYFNKRNHRRSPGDSTLN